MKRIRQLALVAFGLLVPLLLAELALQVSSKFYRATLLATRSEPVDLHSKRILCVGDSNTFGVRVAAADSYPGQLERMLNACSTDGAHWQVLNRGIPGQNTTQIKNSLPELLAWCEPQIVIVLGGINNRWNEASKLEAESILDRSRVLRLLRLAINNFRAGSNPAAGNGHLEVAAITRTDPKATTSDDELRARTTADLESIVELVRAAKATPVIMTYPGQHTAMAPINLSAREVASRLRVLLVDNDLAFKDYVATYGYDAILFEDSHPAEAGYQLESRDIVKAFASAGLAAARLPPDEYAPTRNLKKEISIEIERDADGRPANLRLTAEPNDSFQVYVSPVQEPELDLGSRKVPVGVHPWLQFCSSYAPFKGVIDATGHAHVELPPQIRTMKDDEVLYGAFVTLDPRSAHALAIRSISKATKISRAPPKK